jgi:DNA-binding transcriptional LysR family regulator
MELRHMRYFVAVAEHLHFGHAAEALATAQPSLSRQIAQLEDELGVTLFERTNRHVELSDAGRRFLVDARRTLQAAETSIRHARENADGTRGELRVGFLGGAMLMRLPAILRAYRERFPNVTVAPESITQLEHIPALYAGTIDVAWTVASSDPDIDSQVIASDEILVALPTDHRLANQRTITIKSFTGERLIVLSRSSSPRLYESTLELCVANGFRPVEVIEVPEELAALGLVAAGFGITIAPIPWSAIQIPGLVFRSLATSFSGEQVLSWHRDRNSPIIRSFVATALEQISAATIE